MGVASVTTYGAGSFLSLRSSALIWKSRAVIQRGSELALPAPRATPGRGRTSIDSMRPSVGGSSGSGKTRVIDLTGSATSSFSAGSVFDGGEIRVSRVVAAVPIVKLKRWSGGQGSAGLNWSVRASTQLQAPGWAGAIFTKRSGWSSGPGFPAFSPRGSWVKKIVTGSHRRRKRSGTTTGPERFAAGFAVAFGGAVTGATARGPASRHRQIQTAAAMRCRALDDRRLMVGSRERSPGLPRPRLLAGTGESHRRADRCRAGPARRGRAAP